MTSKFSSFFRSIRFSLDSSNIHQSSKWWLKQKEKWKTFSTVKPTFFSATHYCRKQQQQQQQKKNYRIPLELTGGTISIHSFIHIISVHVNEYLFRRIIIVIFIHPFMMDENPDVIFVFVRVCVCWWHFSSVSFFLNRISLLFIPLFFLTLFMCICMI